jgi:hypothetical protein
MKLILARKKSLESHKNTVNYMILLVFIKFFKKKNFLYIFIWKTSSGSEKKNFILKNLIITSNMIKYDMMQDKEQ